MTRKKVDVDLTPVAVGLTILLVALKLTVCPDWSWWAVTCPVWLPMAATALMVVLVLAVSWYLGKPIILTRKGKEIVHIDGRQINKL